MSRRALRTVLAVGLAVLCAAGLWLLFREQPRRAPLPDTRAEIDRPPGDPLDVPPELMGRRGADAPAPEEAPATAAPAVVETPPAAADEGIVVIQGDVLLVPSKQPVAFAPFTLYSTPGSGDEEGRWRRRVETKVETDRDGRFEARIEATAPITLKGFYCTKAGLRAHAWSPEGAEPGKAIRAAPGQTVRLRVEVTAMIQLKGTVVDEHGDPQAGVRVQYAVPHANNSPSWGGYHTETREGGRFVIMGMLAAPETVLEGDAVRNASVVRFSKQGFLSLVLDVHEVPEAEREEWRVVLPRGHSIAGVLVDEAGRAIPDTTVEAVYEDPAQRRHARTDARGRFTLESLAAGKTTLRAMDLDRELEAREAFRVDRDEGGVRLVAVPVDLDPSAGTKYVMGLRLADVTEAMRKARGLPEHVHVVIEDPGPNSARLGIGTLRPGYGIWQIGHADVKSVKDFVDRILAERADALKRGRGFGGVRIVYVYTGGDKQGWSNTQHMTLSQQDVRALERVQRMLR